MKRKVALLSLPFLLMPIYVSANNIISTDNPSSPISREEMAVVSTRLIGKEGQGNTKDYKSKFIDVSGWSNPYINIASENKIMSGISKNKFNPKGNITNIEVLTILMRTMGYQDGIDFISYPNDYYNKALEIGIADLYTPIDKVLTRSEVSSLIDKAQSLGSSSNIDNISNENSKNNKLELADISFNTSIFANFEGRLLGDDDFRPYEVRLLSKSNRLYGKSSLNSKGEFSIEDFNIDVLSRLAGYKYELYKNGKLVLEDNL